MPDRTLADPECDEFLAAVERLDVPILLHPVALGQDLDLAAGGRRVADEAPDRLGLGLPLHRDRRGRSGSSSAARWTGTRPPGDDPARRRDDPVPGRPARLHAEVYGRGDRFAGERLERRPRSTSRRLYFDTVVHEPASLKLLIDVMGEDNVVLGSNYPGWDNAPIWETIRRSRASATRPRRRSSGATRRSACPDHGLVAADARPDRHPPAVHAETAAAKVQAAEDAWNSRDPDRVALAYTEDSEWRNRDEFINGRDEIRAFLRRKWARELDYRLRKSLWAFGDDRIAVRFEYESRDADGRWWRSYGNENWEFDASGLMAKALRLDQRRADRRERAADRGRSLGVGDAARAA